MISDEDKIIRSNRIFKTIKNFEILFPDEFDKCGINKCGHCRGSGFADIHQMSNCTHCGGMGYKGFERIQGEFVCRTCNGYGCNKCRGAGTVDWIKHANGSDIRTYKIPRNYRPPESV